MINISIMRNNLPLNNRPPYHRWRTWTRTRLPLLLPLHNPRMNMLSHRTRTPPPLYKSHRRGRRPPPHRRTANTLPLPLDDPRPRTLMFMINKPRRRFTPRSANQTLLTNPHRTRTPTMMSIPRLHVSLPKHHRSRLRPASILSQKRRAPI